MGINRRQFLKATGISLGAVGAGLSGFDFDAWAEEHEKAEVEISPSMCNVCSSHCGMWIHVKNDRVWKVTGHEDNDRSLGRLCPRAHGGIDWVYDPDRIDQPLRKTEDGNFEPVSWDEALDDIADRLQQILDEEGPESVFYAHNPRRTGVFYGNRLMHALGVNTICTHNAACNTARTVGFNATMGGVPSPDLANSQYMLLLGRNYGGGIRTSQLKGLQEAVREGAEIICVDPRQNDTATIADEWIPIRPGTDMALVLAMSKVIVDEELYDEEFIEEHTYGFEEFADNLDEYTPEWAELLTDIPAEDIERIARDLAEAAPAAFVHPNWRGAFGCNYENSTETARAVSCLNALLGNVNAEGGLRFYHGPDTGSLDEDEYPAPPVPDTRRADGAGEEDGFPLATSHGLPHLLAEKMLEGEVNAGIVRHHNPVRNFPDYDHMSSGFDALDLLVVFETQISETALVADYVLPECSFAEREEVIESRGGKQGTLAMRTQAISKIHPDTRSFDEIIVDLAERLEVDEYFQFSLDDVNRAILEPYDISLEEFKQKGSMMVDVPEPDEVPVFNTETGKFQFYSDEFERHGAPPVVSWISPDTGLDVEDNQFRLVQGKEAIHSHTATANTPQLAQITKDYDTNRLWINAERASEMGISDGDEVEISSEIFSDRCDVKVTQRIHPETVYIHGGYGNRTPFYTTAQKIDSINPNDFVKYQKESIVGHAMINEVMVEIEKV